MRALIGPHGLRTGAELLAPALYAGVAVAFVIWFGLTPLAWFMVLFAVAAALWTTGWLPSIRGSRTKWLPLIAFWTAYLLQTQVPATAWSRVPIFAGVEVAVTYRGSSSAVGTTLAEEGERFVVLDVELRPRLLADLRKVSNRDFVLVAAGGSFEAVRTRRPDRALPGACDRVPAPRRGSVVCTVVFAVPAAVESGRVEWQGVAYSGTRSETVTLHDRPADMPWIELAVDLLDRRPARGGWDRIAVRVRPEAHGVDGPLRVGVLALELLSGWDVEDVSSVSGVERSCDGAPIEAGAACTAVFLVPRDAGAGRLELYASRPTGPDQGVIAVGTARVAF